MNTTAASLLFSRGLIEPQIDIYPPCNQGCCQQVRVEMPHSLGQRPIQYAYQVPLHQMIPASQRDTLLGLLLLARRQHAAIRASTWSRN